LLSTWQPKLSITVYTVGKLAIEFVWLLSIFRIGDQIFSIAFGYCPSKLPIGNQNFNHHPTTMCGCYMGMFLDGDQIFLAPLIFLGILILII
jgi:hypothetical protein